MSGTERMSFNSNKEDKEMYLSLFQSRDCVNVELGSRILGLQMLLLIFPSCAKDPVLPGAPPDHLFLMKTAAFNLRIFLNPGLWKNHDKEFSAFEGGIPSFESLLFLNVKMFRQGGISGIKKMGFKMLEAACLE